MVVRETIILDKCHNVPKENLPDLASVAAIIIAKSEGHKTWILRAPWVIIHTTHLM